MWNLKFLTTLCCRQRGILGDFGVIQSVAHTNMNCTGEPATGPFLQASVRNQCTLHIILILPLTITALYYCYQYYYQHYYHSHYIIIIRARLVRIWAACPSQPSGYGLPPGSIRTGLFIEGPEWSFAVCTRLHLIMMCASYMPLLPLSFSVTNHHRPTCLSNYFRNSCNQVINADKLFIRICASCTVVPLMFLPSTILTASWLNYNVQAAHLVFYSGDGRIKALWFSLRVYCWKYAVTQRCCQV